METKAVRLYGVGDIRLDEFELPGIEDDEILAKVVSDNICMFTRKTVEQGANHKRVSNNVTDHPIIIGYEFAGDIVQVGKKWQDNFQSGQKFAQQPVIPEQMESPGYPYAWYGSDVQYCIFPNDIIEAGCLWTFEGDGYSVSSVAEPVSCVIDDYHIDCYTAPGAYQHMTGTKEGGNTITLDGCGPVGLEAISYRLTLEDKPKYIVATEINDERTNRARKVISEEGAATHGVELAYVNTVTVQDQVKELMVPMSEGGYDDVFVYIPNHAVCEMGNSIITYDSCMNLFAGSTDMESSPMINLYNCHYSGSKTIGSTDGTIDDMREVTEKGTQGLVESAVMIAHVGSLDSIMKIAENLPDTSGDEKLVYIHINMPMAAISDFIELREQDPFFKELDVVCKKNRGLWSVGAEKMLLEYFR